MEQRVYHGTLSPEDLARMLLETWDRDQTMAQAFGEGPRMIVQIGQREAGWFSDEPRQALTLDIESIDDGVQVTMGQQQWYKDGGGQIMVGGLIGFLPFFFTFPLGRLFGGDDGIDDSLPGQIWRSIDQYVGQFGAATGATQRLQTIACPECGVANPQNARQCSACGAALTPPETCPHCGYLNPTGARFCNRCGSALASYTEQSVV
jgi:ribosomal protein L40E